MPDTRTDTPPKSARSKREAAAETRSGGAASSNKDPRRERTRQLLLEGGRRVMASKGVDAATVLEIVAEAGVSQPSFYNHFESKEALLNEIVRSFIFSERALKERVVKDTGDRALSIAWNCRRTIRMLSSDPIVAQVVVRAGVMRNILGAPVGEPLIREIEEGIRAGRMKVESLPLAISAIIGGALSVIQLILDGEAGPDPDARYAELVLRMLGIPAAQAERLAFKPLPDFLRDGEGND